MKKYIFLSLVLFLWLFSLYKSGILDSYDKHLSVEIIKQIGKITDLNTPVKKAFVKKIVIDRVDFPPSGELYHKMYGNLGFKNNFFMKIGGNFKIKSDEIINFIVKSDDGFKMQIDGKTVCKHIKNRPFRSTSCKYRIKKGTHSIIIKYFQGYGPLGLQAFYKIGRHIYFIGQSSKMVQFFR